MDRRRFIQQGGAAASLGGIGLGLPLAALAQPRKETARVLAEGAPNSQDPHGEGVSRESLGLFTNVYDRLINFDRVPVSPGVFKYDYGRFRGELAESFEQSADGRTLTFRLRRDATFHDGRPVTANDVKWSLDRAVSLPASRRQLGTGSLENPSQFSVVDAHTFRITLPRADRYTLPNLALSFASVLNAELARSHATGADPWATEWVKANAAGGGAYRVENFTPGQQVIYTRFDGWKSGAVPRVRRAVFQVVPSASNRVAALLKGDADVALQLPPKDLDALTDTTRAKVLSVPVTTSFRFVAFNTQAKPFDDVRVRQAIAYALPYTSLLRGANLGRGEPLYGAKSDKPTSSRFPQPYPYETQLLRARELLAQAGLAKGFKTSFSYNVGDATLAEPAALLIQEALGKIGIELSIEKVPGAQWGTLQTEKKLPFFIDSSSAWFNDPDYFFRIFFQGDWRWNFGSFRNEELAKLVEQARWETDRAKYDRAIRRAIEIAFEQVPLVPLWLPSFEAALQPDLQGFTYYIHGQVDFRPLTRS
ncbi:ABC transporter substrate-binding protein [Variovorax sp. OV700]|uniref:ABC transporter substrate-binding protein n=1 Tax=Variovorax sp. OV700 TaxID=1882826 RepID=UPI0008847C86|nr:ABC transporter substrate-binding protein [Variovorax sp. OV700]SDI17796.1 peptide/nickel transport system substrate-binding protein [Variovorax sp. OV700]